jgi:hypothetical protein
VLPSPKFHNQVAGLPVDVSLKFTPSGAEPDVGEALKLAFTAVPVLALTVTVALALALPPVPVQLKLYVAFWLRAPVFNEPLVGWAPLQAPLAEQLSALVELQVRVLAWPAVRLTGEELSVTVGAGIGGGVGP